MAPLQECNFLYELGRKSYVIAMIMYYDDDNLIIIYEEYHPDQPYSPLFCPLTAPFNRVLLWMGPNPPAPPLTGSSRIPLEKVTSLTIDQFTRLMLGEPQKACFTFNEDTF